VLLLQEHLFLVCELLRANLYEFQKHNRESGDPPYFTLPHIQSIARQVGRNDLTYLGAGRELGVCVLSAGGLPSRLVETWVP